MTVVLQTRDRCRICFSLLLRDRSLCCQKSYHLFQHIQRRKLPWKKFSAYQTKIRNSTVCFRDLIFRYLRTSIDQTQTDSNLICSDCSMMLLDIEQCAKYLRKTINQLKVKFNKSNRLRTSSLSATFQKKKYGNIMNKEEQLPIHNSDSDDAFDDIDDDEESDDEQDNPKPSISTNINLKSLQLPPSSSLANDSISNIIRSKHHTNNNNHSCNGNNHGIEEEEEDDDDDDDEEDGLIKSSTEKYSSNEFSPSRNILFNSNGLMNTATTMNFDEANANLFQMRLAQMMASIAHSSNSAQNFNDSNNAMMNTFANIQRNIVLQFLNDPMAAAQAAAAATAAISSSQIKPNSIPSPSNNKQQISSGRKRKSTPEKRPLTNHPSSNNNNNSANTSPIIEHESSENHIDSINHPLELTTKGFQQSNRILSSTSPDIHNLVKIPKFENGSPSYYSNQRQIIDEDRKESTIPNDSSSSLSPSLIRRSAPSKRQKSSSIGQYDYSNKFKINLSNDLLSPNHQSTLSDESNQSKQQRKLDPRTCAECGKVLFSDKTLLLHCQTHAKNEKQCWICGTNDDDIKKHILNEHGNQKFTNTGFKCQHCEKVFPIYNDLINHMREHTKKKPFECPICYKRFGQQGNLSCHLRIHSGVKPFTCASCGKAFRHSNSLRRHARTVHSASRGLSMSPGSMDTTPSSLLLATATTSNSMVSMANDLHHSNINETFDDTISGQMIPSDEGESLQDPPSVSSTGALSPAISNAQNDSDSHEPFGSS